MSAELRSPQDGRPSVLVVARSYRPAIGGLERFSAELTENLADRTDVTAIVNRHDRRVLPAFLPYAGVATLLLTAARKIQHVHLCDGALAPLGAALRPLLRRPISISVHGLDLTYPNRAYQRLLTASLGKLDLVVAGSAATRQIAVDRFPELEPKTVVINYGVRDRAHSDRQPDLPARFADQLAGRPVVLTVGRLIRRKGVLWFLENVLTLLPSEVAYLVVGDGPDRNAIELAAQEAGVRSRVILTGELSDDDLTAALHRADLFVMPNVNVSDDMEGFGLVALEASISDLPVVASRIQGITDAIIEDKNGVLVEPEDPRAFAAAIVRLLDLDPAARADLGHRYADYTRSHYAWSAMADAYLDAFAHLDRELALGNPGSNPAEAPVRASGLHQE